MGDLEKGLPKVGYWAKPLAQKSIDVPARKSFLIFSRENPLIFSRENDFIFSREKQASKAFKSSRARKPSYYYLSLIYRATSTYLSNFKKRNKQFMPNAWQY